MTAFREFIFRFAVGVGIAAVVITAVLAILARVVKSPANLGVRNGKLAPCPNSPNCVSTQSDDPRHQIDPIPYTTTPEKARMTLLQVIRSMERSEVVIEDPTYIRAEFRTKGMGYVDDVELYLDQEAGLSTSGRARGCPIGTGDSTVNGWSRSVPRLKPQASSGATRSLTRDLYEG
jgi:uncharacterized protein (DUF1499 family)